MTQQDLFEFFYTGTVIKNHLPNKQAYCGGKGIIYASNFEQVIITSPKGLKIPAWVWEEQREEQTAERLMRHGPHAPNGWPTYHTYYTKDGRKVKVACFVARIEIEDQTKDVGYVSLDRTPFRWSHLDETLARTLAEKIDSEIEDPRNIDE